MSKKILLALNWKLNKTPSEAAAWAQSLREQLVPSQAALAVMTSAINLPAVSAALSGSVVGFGAQDVSQHASGAYTGETSVAQLNDLGAQYSIVGHSERRQYHGESDAVVAAKARQAIAHGIVPIVCVGEGLEIREAGEQVAYTLDQLRGSLEGVNIDNADQLVIAYEPVWAIGTGKTATAQDAEELAAAIRGLLQELYPSLAADIIVQYGGSVKPGNIAEICAQPNVNGALVGGAALELDSVLGMLSALA